MCRLKSCRHSQSKEHHMLSDILRLITSESGCCHKAHSFLNGKMETAPSSFNFWHRSIYLSYKLSCVRPDT